MDKIKILALFGKSASGKDTLQKWIVNNVANTQKIVSYTTRPPREGEQDGIDYHYISQPEFCSKVLSGEMLEATSFRNWFYGTSIEALDKTKVNVGVFNPAGIRTLLDNTDLWVIPVYINATDKTRLLRSLNREEDPDCHEICRRFLADEEAFEDLGFNYYMTYVNQDDLVSKDYFKAIISEIFEGDQC